MVEPRYKNIADLGMEFYSDGHHVVYRGLSLFSTCSGFYEGNIIASEEDKAKLISPLLPKKKLLILSHTLEKELRPLQLAGKYTGPLGVDMLITDNHAVHPMVEIKPAAHNGPCCHRPIQTHEVRCRNGLRLY